MMTLQPLLGKISVFSILLLLMFFIPDTEASGKRGKSFQRSGHASSGSFRGSKAVRKKAPKRRSKAVRKKPQQEHLRQPSKQAVGRRHVRRHRTTYVDRRISVDWYSSQSCPHEVKLYDGAKYYRCGCGWYYKGYEDGEVVYILVTAIPGC